MIKRIAFAAILALIATGAYADESTTVSGSQSQAGASAGVNIQNGNGYRQAPSAIAPGLIAGGLSCSGSASLGGAGAGWGVSLGITKEDAACNTREDAKYIHGVTGSAAAAKERLCEQREIREAFARAGQPCAGDAVSVVSKRRTTIFGFSSKSTTTGYAKPAARRVGLSHRLQ